ncbi:hypothetical protein HF923_12945 [Acidithiobacillus ferriphilus]|uniref:hypothetical protein n=1 Tax=Acidithiobacillus ferriphilus TaxID=1689834 RepID=UPI001C0793D8|nr:hypothetical protein [Acidithiobacillus ferriphilus]MBU2846699.1 hypothetical protein [Acidithiobacillus ferriphilus]MEB8475255.1 hypothetical protein [Acidithiobacillus ferriphilus]
MRIAIDADQVLFDFDAAWRMTAGQVLGRPMPKPAPTYHLMVRYGLTTSEYHKVWAGFEVMGMWARCPIIPEALDRVRMWLDMGHKVFVASTVDAHVREQREAALDRMA